MDQRTWFVFPASNRREKVRVCFLHVTDDSFMNKYDAGFVGRLKLKVEAVPALKGHESEPSNICVVLELDMLMDLKYKDHGYAEGNAAKEANGTLC